jgi:hypothetical protein
MVQVLPLRRVMGVSPTVPLEPSDFSVEAESLRRRTARHLPPLTFRKGRGGHLQTIADRRTECWRMVPRCAMPRWRRGVCAVADSGHAEGFQVLRVKPWQGFGVDFALAERLLVALQPSSRSQAAISTGVPHGEGGRVAKATRMTNRRPSIRSRPPPNDASSPVLVTAAGGHDRPIMACAGHVRSTTYSSRGAAERPV